MLATRADEVQQGRRGIAPVWHTCVLIAAFIAIGLGEIAGAHHGSPLRAIPFYIEAIVFELALFAFVWWGIRMRHYPLAALISRGRVTWFKRDLVYGLGIWACWYAVLGLVTMGLAAARITNAGAPGTVFPHGAAQVTLWIAMAVSSGFAEELAFRGYLLQQFSSWTGSTAVAIVLQAILFGIGHAYLGARQALLIIASGVVMGLFAAWLRNIRPLMVAHAWADIFGGIIEHGLPYK